LSLDAFYDPCILNSIFKEKRSKQQLIVPHGKILLFAEKERNLRRAFSSYTRAIHQIVRLNQKELALGTFSVKPRPPNLVNRTLNVSEVDVTRQ
jgi:hypothetical protein